MLIQNCERHRFESVKKVGYCHCKKACEITIDRNDMYIYVSQLQYILYNYDLKRVQTLFILKQALLNSKSSVIVVINN